MQSAKMYFAAQTATQKNLKNLYLNASWTHGADHVFFKKNFAETYIHYHEFKLNIHSSVKLLKYKEVIFDYVDNDIICNLNLL